MKDLFRLLLNGLIAGFAFAIVSVLVVGYFIMIFPIDFYVGFYMPEVKDIIIMILGLIMFVISFSYFFKDNA